MLLASIRESGDSRRARMSVRRSLRATAAARRRRLSPNPAAMALRELAEQGTMIMASQRNEPEATEAPMSALGC